MTEARHTIETLASEIERIVGERQQLRDHDASAELLEPNRRKLVEAQALMSRLLIARYLPPASVAA